MNEQHKTIILRMSEDALFSKLLEKHPEMKQAPVFFKDFECNGKQYTSFSWDVADGVIIAAAWDHKTAALTMVEAEVADAASNNIQLTELGTDVVFNLSLTNGVAQFEKVLDNMAGATCYSKCMAECDCDPGWFESYYYCVASWSVGCLAGCKQSSK